MQPLIVDNYVTPQVVTPLISVVLPVFNAEQHISDAVNSILGQTLRDFELIVIDDGSTDNTLIILKQLTNRDNRIRLISRSNKGLVESLNEGISLARGKWIARMDADDIALPYRFERQLQWLVQTGADMTGSWIKLFGTQDRRIVKHAQTDAAIKMEMLFGSPFAHPTVMMRTALVKQLHYDKAWEKAEDYDLWERAAQAGWRMTNVPEVLLLYRQHKTQISKVAAIRQEEYTHKIQRRCWEIVTRVLPISSQDIDEVLRIREQPSHPLAMKQVDAVFFTLLKNTHGETRDIVIYYAFRLYLRATAHCGDVLRHWIDLCHTIDRKAILHEQLGLWLLQLFNANAHQKIFNYMKKINRILNK